MYTLAEHGDPIERQFYPLFIETYFPSYEEFWKREVVPITSRKPPFFRTDDELYAMGKSPLDWYLAQLHYTVLFHLGTARLSESETDQTKMEYTFLMCKMTRLVAAQDVAFELMTWWKKKENGEWNTILRECEQQSATNGKSLMMYFEKKARTYAENWRRAMKEEDIKQIAKYRNAMIHRGVRSVMVDNNGIALFPKIDKVYEYCDWRQHRKDEDFVPASEILQTSWELTAKYFDQQWRDVLLK